MRYLAFVAFLASLLFSAIYVPLDSKALGVILSLVAGIILLLLDEMLKSGRLLGLSANAYLLFSRSPIRISISCLVRIKVDDLYLLVRGRRITRQFQPVGGVLKSYPQAADFLSSIGAVNDNLIPVDPRSKDDLRIRVKGRYIPRLLRWFLKQRDRETSPWREFYDDLIGSEILSRQAFPYAHFRRIGVRYSGINYVDYAQSYQLLIAEVFALVPDEQQLLELRKIINVPSEKYVWVNSGSILQRGVIPGKSFEGMVAPTAEWIV